MQFILLPSIWPRLIIISIISQLQEVNECKILTCAATLGTQLQSATQTHTEARNVESSPGHGCSCTSAKVMVHIRKLVWLKTSQNMEEKDKTKIKPLSANPVGSDPTPKAAAGTGERQQGCFAAGPAQCPHKTLLHKCVQQMPPHSIKEKTLSGGGC